MNLKCIIVLNTDKNNLSIMIQRKSDYARAGDYRLVDFINICLFCCYFVNNKNIEVLRLYNKKCKVITLYHLLNDQKHYLIRNFSRIA